MKTSLDYGMRSFKSKFININLLPTIDFSIDKQMEQSLICDGIEIGKIREFMLGFCWLNLYFYITFETKL